MKKSRKIVLILDFYFVYSILNLIKKKQKFINRSYDFIIPHSVIWNPDVHFSPGGIKVGKDMLLF